jgi:hypothetical protein
MKIENPNPYGPLTEARLKKFEEVLGATLPADYRDFLLRYNGGVPSPSDFWLVKNEDCRTLFGVYGLHDKEEENLEELRPNGEWGVPVTMLPIGNDGSSNEICVGIGGKDRGKVFFVDCGEHDYDDPNSRQGITKIADSFSEFLKKLTKYEE